ncbi:MAG: hypothetical protein QM775_15285 [Pirellulales bacterium]
MTNWGEIPAVMAEGFLPDPCPWSPDLPFLYRVVGTIRLGERTIAEIHQTFGIRPLSVVRNRIKFQERTWVPRAVHQSIFENAPKLEQWRDSASTLIAENSNFEFLNAADDVGVSVIAKLPDDATGQDVVRRLSRHPSVMFVHSGAFLRSEFRDAARNTLFICCNPRSFSEFAEPDVLEVCIDDASAHIQDATNGSLSMPIFVCRMLESATNMGDARSACDTLQRDVIGLCDPAGYIV